MLPWEKGPVIAGDVPDPQAQRELEEMQDFVLASMDDPAAAAFTELVDGSTGLDEPTARVAADLLLRAMPGGSEDETGAKPPEVDPLMAAWRAVEWPVSRARATSSSRNVASWTSRSAS